MGNPRTVVRGFTSSFYVIFTVPKTLEEKTQKLLDENRFTAEVEPCRMINFRSWKVLVSIRRAYTLQKMIQNLCEMNKVTLYD